jgi:hypothetical protein
MRFGIWNIRGLYRAGLLMTVAKEILDYKLDLVGVQKVRCERVVTELGKWNENYELGTGSFVHKRIISAANRVESVSLKRTAWQECR